MIDEMGHCDQEKIYLHKHYEGMCRNWKPVQVTEIKQSDEVLELLADIEILKSMNLILSEENEYLYKKLRESR